MTTTQQLITKLHALDIKLAAQGGKLQIHAPHGVLTPELRAELAARKADLLEFFATHQQQQPILPVAGTQAPLAYAQRRLWFLEQLGTTGATYHLATLLRLDGQLQVAALMASLEAIVARHASLRTTYTLVDGEPVQQIAPTMPVMLTAVDLTSLPVAEQEAAVLHQTQATQQLRFDLQQGPLWRFLLFELGEQRWMLAIIMHHLITDEWSTAVLVREVSHFYTGFVTGQPTPLPPLPIQYADYATWQRQQLATPQWQTQLGRVCRTLAAAPQQLALPFDYARPAAPTLAAAAIPFVIEPRLTARVKALAHSCGTTLYATGLALYALLLARYSGQHDLVIGSPVANRERQELEPLIGFLVNTVALRMQVTDTPSFRTLLAAVRAQVLDSVATANIPFEQVVETLQPERHLNRNPLFQTMFVWQHQLHEGLELPALTVELVPLPIPNLPVDLLLTMREEADQLVGQLHYSTDLFTAATIEQMVEHLYSLLAAVVAQPDHPVATLPLYQGAALQQRLAEWRGPVRPDLLTTPLHELFEQQAARTPAAPALYTHDQALRTALSYAELNARANQLAHHLLAAGHEAGERLAICTERGPWMMIAMLAVLKIGATYLPLDPTYPAQRLAYLLEDAQATCLLAQRDLAGSLPTVTPPVVWLDQIDLTVLPTHNPGLVVPMSTPAYQIYTSGSTGLPKGVVVPHQGVANTIRAIGEQIGLGPGDRLFQFVPFGFDAAAIDFFTSLTYGAALVFYPNPTRLSAEELLDLCCRDQVTVVNFTVALWQQWVDNLVLQGKQFPRHLRVFLTGGDKPSALTLRSWATLGDHPMLYCCSYGPTEASITTTFYTITNEQVWQDPPALIPLGPPLPNVALYLLDQGQQIVPGQVPGEIYIGGAGVAAGYWQRPALTAERFVVLPPFDQPAAAHSPLRLYRTGDLARRLADGTVEFVGRVDTQIKIRGFRVELGEIESRLKALPLVREAVVLAVGSGVSDKRIVAYVQLTHPTPPLTAMKGSGDCHADDQREAVDLLPPPNLPQVGGGTAVSPTADRRPPQAGEGWGGVSKNLPRRDGWEEVAEALRGTLPEHMLPAAWVLIEQWPFTPNGKIDRQQLPLPTFAAVDEVYVAPTTPLAEQLALIWQQVLGVEQVGVTSNFFTLGGHSLLATQVVARIGQQLGLTLPLRTLFEKPTIAELAAELATQQPGATRPLLQPVNRNQPLPLSFAQRRLWLLAQLDPASTAYHIPAALRLTGRLDHAALVDALTQLVARHESLRTCFFATEGEPVQQILPALTVPFMLVDLRQRPVEEREAAAANQAHVAMQVPFDLAAGPLLRATLFQLAEDDAILLVLMHHIVTDGWSIPILLREVAELYLAQVESRAATLPLLPLHYADYAHWQRQWLQGEVLEQQLAYWRTQLAEAPALLALPTDRPRPARPTYQAAAFSITLAPAVVEKLYSVAQQSNATPYMVVLSTLALLLARYSGQTDLVIGSPIANRTDPAIEGLIGFFVNTLALRIDLRGGPDFAGLVARVRETTLAAYAHQDAPFDQVIDALQLPRNLSHAPLFQVLLAWQNAPATGNTVALPDLEIAGVAWHKPTLDYDLALDCSEADGALTIIWQYSTDLFDRATMSQMAAHFQTLLAAAVAAPTQAITALPLFAPDQLPQHLATGAGPVEPTLAGACLHQLFAAQVERTPAAPAIFYQDMVLTYQELNQQANQLAHALLAQGYGRGDRIAICLNRAPQLVVAILAVLKSGAAYLPLDPAYPPQRLAYLLTDAAATLLISESALTAQVPAFDGPIYWLDQLDVTTERCTNPLVHVERSDPFYQIYTSGSTGLPKSVLIAHQGVANTIQATARLIALGPEDRFLQFIPLGFDAAAIDLFAPLSCGAAIVIHPHPTQLADHELLALCVEYQVTVTNFATARWQQLVTNLARQQGRFPANLRAFLTGGEKASPPLLRAWAELGDHPMIFVSSYGPSEASISAMIYRTTNTAVRATPPTLLPLGQPLPNVQIYLLDEAQQPVPVGVAGELYIGGIGVGAGYWQRPELSAERFLTVPAWLPPSFPGARLYRTGDLARQLADGRYEFVGRVDSQVKIRGFRVELGELEGQLRQLPGVREAVVLARAAAGQEKQLVAYVQTTAASITQHQLATQLQELLPPHLLPAAWVLVDQWPLTPNGKIDRQQLPMLTFTAPDAAFLAPSTPVELALAQIWQEVLGLEQIGVQSNFFDLGGHSLSATQVVARIRQQLGVSIPMRTLFAAPTIGQLATAISAAQPAAVRPPLVHVEETLPPLSFGQQRLWLLQQLNPTSGFFNMPAALWLEGALDRAALQTAFDQLVERHASLRTTFPLVNGAPVQQIAPPTPLPLAHYTLAEVAPAGEAALLDWVITTAAQPFDLQAGPLVRVALVQVTPMRHLLLVNLHHTIGDDWSRRIFMAEFSRCYQAAFTGATPALPTLPLDYADFARWQRVWLQGPQLQAQLDYWRAQLADAPPLLELPTDRPRPAQQRFVGARLPVTVAEPLATGLRHFSRQANCTLHMTLLAGFAALLARYSGMDDLVIGIPVAGRTDPQIEGVIGFFLNTLALRIRLTDAMSFQTLVEEVKAVSLAAYAHQEAPFEQVIEVVSPTPQLSHTPIFQVMFDLAQADRTTLTLPGVRVTPLAFDLPSAKFDLNLVFAEAADGGLTAIWEYSRDLFDHATVEQLARHLDTLLQAALASPTQPVSQLPLLTPAERRQLLEGWNQTARPVPSTKTMQQLFEAQAAATPTAIAAYYRDETLTYGALNARANRWAQQLVAWGVTADVIVTPCWPRDLDFLTAILAIFKAGGAYLPLDPQLPGARLAQVIGQSQTPLVLTNHDFRPLLESALATLPAEQRPQLRLVEELDAAAAPTTNLPRRNGPASLAYVIFTSGSTGVPKGVMVEQQGLVNHLYAMQHNLRLTAADIIGQTATQSYVISVWQFLAALTCGAAIRIVPEETMLDPGALLTTLAQTGISVAQVVPSLLRLLLEALERQSAIIHGGRGRLRWMIPTGEALPPALAQRWFACCPQIPLLNAYGSSECSDDVTHDLIAAPPSEDVVTMPIGQPIPNVQTYVLDTHQQPTPFGVAGELYVGGAGVGRGYLHEAARTAQVFLPNPFATEPGARLYKTGDRVRRLRDGTIEYLGRFDFQVKVRGIRVELGEIEATLGTHGAVAQAIVVANADHAGQQQLVAYVVLKTGNAATSHALRLFLGERLPDYMVPALIVILAELPLNSSGKVARRLLPAPTQLLAQHTTPYVAPRNAVETTLVEILATVLGLETATLGVHHNFFDLGGHSMQAIQIVWQLRDRLGVDLPLRALFEQSTVAQLATLVLDAQLAQLDEATLDALFAEVVNE